MSPHGTVRSDGDSVSSRSTRSRALRFVAAATAAGLAVGVAASTGISANAATADSGPNLQAQSVGNFLDATLGGSTLDAVAKLAYASAESPGAGGTQNPLDVTALGQINLPLTGALQLPQIAGIKLGAVNQVAKANHDGSSYGASGAVTNSGGVSVGGDNDAYPANATIDLTAAGLTGNGTGPAAALGGVTASIGGVAGLASTPKGYGKAGATTYQIANVDLSIGSPLLGGLLTTILNPLQSGLASVVTGLTSGLAGTVLPADCKLVSPSALTDPISLEGGAITIDAAKATLTVSLGKLLKQLGLDLNKLPANTDLVQYLLAYLADPKGLSAGLQGVINGLLDPLTAEFTKCTDAINAIPGIGGLLTGLVKTLTDGKATLEKTITDGVASLVGAAGVNPLKPVADLLSNLIDIGVNVQPNGKAGSYSDPLEKTAKQGLTPVDGQTIVRAIEVNVAAAAGSSLGGGAIPSLGDLGLGSLFPGSSLVKPLAAAAPSTGILTLALGNGAAGPSAAPVVATPTPTPTTSVPSTNVPTGVPAGSGSTGGSPLLPLVFVLIALGLAAGGVTTYRIRGARGLH